MSTITKRDLVVEIAQNTGLTQAQVSTVVEAFTSSVSEHLSNGNSVVMRNFGSFEPALRKAKVGRNPAKPSVAIKIPARKVVKFNPGKELKESVAA